MGFVDVVLELRAQLVDEVVDRARRAVVVEAPDLVEDLVAGEDAPAVLDQVLEQVELAARALLRRAVDDELLAREVDLQVPLLELVDLAHDRLAPPEHGLDARGELLDRERLRHVVVGPELEPEHLVALVALRRQDDDRDAGVVLAHRLAHLEAVELGQHQVEEHEIGLLVEGLLDRLLAVLRDVDGVALEAEASLEAEPDRGVVLDDQDAGRHAAASPGSFSAMWVRVTGASARASSRPRRGRASPGRPGTAASRDRPGRSGGASAGPAGSG